MWRYSDEPADRAAFPQAFDRFYTPIALVYDVAVTALPAWQRWLRRARPHPAGPRVLEVSFGTGRFMTSTPGRFETDGVDLNERTLATARENA